MHEQMSGTSYGSEYNIPSSKIRIGSLIHEEHTCLTETTSPLQCVAQEYDSSGSPSQTYNSLTFVSLCVQPFDNGRRIAIDDVLGAKQSRPESSLAWLN